MILLLALREHMGDLKIESTAESVCETLSSFLGNFDGLDEACHSVRDLGLSGSESVIMECALSVENLGNISEEIEQTFVPSLERDQRELREVFDTLEKMSMRTIPSLNQDLEKIEELTVTLESRLDAAVKAKNSDWMKVFTLGFGGGTKRGTDYTRYKREVNQCTFHDKETLIKQLMEPSPAPI